MPAETNDRHSALFADLLRSFARVMAARPLASLVVLAAICVVCGVYTSRNLQFKSDRSDLIDPDADFQQRWLNYTKSFGDSSDIVVVVEAKSPEVITPVLDELGQRLKEETASFRNVFFKVEHDHLRRKGLQFFSPQQLENCLTQLNEMRPVIQGDWDQINLESVLSQLLRRMYLLKLAIATGQDAQTPLGQSPAQRMQMIGQHVTALATSMSHALRNPKDTRNPWPQLVPVDSNLAAAATRPKYSLNDRGTQGFVKLAPVIDKQDFNGGATAAIKRIREIIAEVKHDHPHVKIGITGIPVLEYDEMARSQSDMTLATIVSGVGVLLLLLGGFHGIRHPLIAMVMLGIGLIISFAFATAKVGHLNILSASFAPILMGLGCDYAIMYLSRYLELRHQGESLQDAIGNTSASVGESILTVAIVTALAFYCATLTKFLGVAELGIISAGGVILCAIASFFALPPLIAFADRNVLPAKLPTPIKGNALRWAVRRHPWLVMIGGLAVMFYFGGWAFRIENGWPRFAIGYDCNLLNLQAKGLESVDLQDRVFKESQSSLLFAVTLADSAEQAIALKAEFEKLRTVRKVEELASKVEELESHLPSTSPEQTKLLIQAIHAEVAQLTPVKFEPRVVNPELIGQMIERLHNTLSESEELWAKQAVPALDDFLENFSVLPIDQQIRFLNEFQARMNFALHAQLQAMADASDPEPITLEDFLPKELVSRFVSAEGKWQIQIYPKEQIWDIEPLQAFVEDVRSVDPEVTGTPLQNFEASQQIKESYHEAAMYAFVAIWITLLIDLMGRSEALRVLTPPAILLVIAAIAMRSQNITINWQLMGVVYLAMAIAITWLVDATAVYHSMLALLPSLGGAAIMFGLMRLMHVDLNPANLIVLPLLLGLGMDGGVHVVHDYRLQSKRRYRISPSIINSLVLTSTTTMVGFGSMLLAAHRGLYTFGLVLTIGCASCVFLALIPLPAILTLLDQRRRKKLVRQTKRPTIVPDIIPPEVLNAMECVA